MSNYGLRDNKFSAKEISVKALDAKSLEVTKEEASNSVTYIKMDACANGGDSVYLFVGTAGRLCISSTLPIATSGVFANKGGILGTAA